VWSRSEGSRSAIAAQVSGVRVDPDAFEDVDRVTVDDVTLFTSVGLGVQDLAVLDLLHQEALARGVGTRVRLRD
jgi:ornithine cyclodeaminase/alanine dehydrogenase-like protein (mu-crystallin family)